jgi:signal transduction histidine kinase
LRSLRQKLFLSYALLLLGVAGGSLWSLYHFRVLGRSVARIMADNYRSVLDAQQMKEALERQDSAMQFHIAGYDEKARRQYDLNRRRFAERYADAAANITEAGEPAVIRAIGAQWQGYQRLSRDFLDDRSRPRAEQARGYFARLEPAFLALKDRCDDLLRLNQDAMLAKQRRAEDQARAATQATVALTFGLLAVGILYAVNLSRALIAPLRRLAAAARAIGEGDLETHLSFRTGDEVQVVADEFNRMADRLQVYREREAARLHVAEEQGQAAINSLYEPVIVTGAAGELVDLNRAAENLFGPSGRWLRQPVEALGVDAVARAVRAAIAERQPVAPDGEPGLVGTSVGPDTRCYRIRTAPILLPAAPPASRGEVAGTVTTLEDVTRQRELDRLKDEFIAVASHELRTPLTSLKMAVYLLGEGAAGALSPRQEQLVKGAREDSDRLEGLMQDLLDLSRLEGGRRPPVRRPTPPLDLVQQGLDPLREPAQAKGLSLQVAVPHDLPAVLADPSQIGRVVTNLVGNALRHTDRGGITVAARPEGERVIFSVTDTGTGIPREYLGRIFERFAQVPGSRSGGAGLGLSIARKIVEQHGGAIGVESEVGKGSTFWFSLPAATAAPPREGEDERDAHPDR